MAGPQVSLPLQVIGDSFARRFTDFLKVGSHSLFSMFSLGISGAKIQDVKYHIKQKTLPIVVDIPLLVLIGTNDFLSGVGPAFFKNQFLSLLRLIRRTYPGIVVILVTLPSYPRVRSNSAAIQELHRINSFLLTLQSESTKVVKLPHYFANLDFFHAFYGKSRRRDGIHFNKLAHQALEPLLLEVYNQAFRSS